MMQQQKYVERIKIYEIKHQKEALNLFSQPERVGMCDPYRHQILTDSSLT